MNVLSLIEHGYGKVMLTHVVLSLCVVSISAPRYSKFQVQLFFYKQFKCSILQRRECCSSLIKGKNIGKVGSKYATKILFFLTHQYCRAKEILVIVALRN